MSTVFPGVTFCGSVLVGVVIVYAGQPAPVVSNDVNTSGGESELIVRVVVASALGPATTFVNTTGVVGSKPSVA
jgi:hypothetical protein